MRDRPSCAPPSDSAEWSPSTSRPNKRADQTANNQVLHGTCGPDTFFVGPHIGVTIYAGAGNDDVRAGFNAGVTTAYLGDGNDEVSASGVVTVRAHGEAGNDILIGGSEDDFLYGGTGNDTLEGRSGTDLMTGDSGNDTFYARSGSVPESDYVSGGTGFDKATIDNAD